MPRDILELKTENQAYLAESLLSNNNARIQPFFKPVAEKGAMVQEAPVIT